MSTTDNRTWIYAEAIEMDSDAPGSWIRVDVDGRVILIQVPRAGITRDTGAEDDAPYVPTASKATPDDGALISREATCNVCGEGAADPTLENVCLECDAKHHGGEGIECEYCRADRPAARMIVSCGSYPIECAVCERCFPSALSETTTGETFTLAEIRRMIDTDGGAWTTAQARAREHYSELLPGAWIH